MISTWRHLLLFLLLTVVPGGYSILLLTHEGDEGRATWARDLQETLQNRMARLRYRAQPLVLANQALRGLISHLEGCSFRPGSTSSPLPNPFPEGFTVQIGIFSPEGEFWQPDWAPVTSRFLWKQMWQDFQNRQIPPRQLERYKKLFGSWMTSEDARQDERLQEITTPTGPGFFSVHRGAKKSGLIVFIPGLPSPLARWRWVLARERVGNLGIWVGDPRTGKSLGRGRRSALDRTVFRRAVLEPGTTEFLQEACYSSQLTEDNLVLVGRIPARWSEPRQVGQKLLLLLTLSGPIWWLLAGGRPLSKLGILPRLLILFGISSFLPVFLLVRTGWRALEQTEHRLTEEVHERNLDRLRAADAVLRGAQEKQDRLFRRVEAKALTLARRSYRAAEAFLEAVRRRGGITSFAIHDQGGKVRASWWSDPKGGDLADLFAREMLRRYRDDRYPLPNESVGWTFFQFIQSPAIGFDAISDSPGVSRFLTVGAASVLWYWEVCAGGTASEPGFLGLIRPTRDLHNEILEQDLPDDVYAFDIQNGHWYPKTPPIPELDTLLGPAFTGKRIAIGRKPVAGRESLVTVFPSTVQERYCFLAATDLEPVFVRLGRLRFLFLFVAAFTLVLAGLLAQVIFRTLLQPLRLLTDGVAAYEGGRHDLLLPDLGETEVGTMGRMLNAMVQEAREVNSARQVQESLIPAQPETVPGYRTALRYLPLEDLAGDYCDTILRPDGTLFLAIGDVTGHGIGSALQTAMAKAVCSQSCREGRSLPETFARLNPIIQMGKASRLFMTFCGGLLDPRTHTWHWISAGHPYPLLRKADGTIGFLRHSGVPLGIRSVKTWAPSQIVIEPGDLVLFYTDGLAESTNAEGEPFGYTRLERLLASTNGHPEEVVEQILSGFRRFVGDTPLTDDVTLLVFSR